MQKFLDEIADVLDADDIKESDVLADFDEFDSLSVLTIISLAGSKYKKMLTAHDVRACKTVKDLYNLING